MNYCLKNGVLVDPAAGRHGQLDIIIKDGVVSKVGPDLEAHGCEVFDLHGLHVLPGLIDIHVHLRDPGEEEKETIATGTKAAAKGGFTSIAAMPNTRPPADDSTVIKYVLTKAESAGIVNVYPIANITKSGQGEEMAELGELAAAGAVAFSDDGASVMNAETQRAAFEYGRLFSKVFLLHCEDKNLAKDGVMHESAVSTRLGLKGIPGLAEEIIVARDIQLAEATGAQIHICHLSTEKSLELVRAAKARGVKVTAEATPHHLSLIDEDVAGFDTSTKVNPPLRSRVDREALRQGLVDGTIDLIATDHAPHTKEEKNKEYPLAPCGMIGLETALGVMFTEFYHNGLIDLPKLVDLMSLRPARLLQIPGGTLSEGSPADLVVIDPNLKWKVRKEDFFSKSSNSPFIGKELTGKNLSTMVGGRWVYDSSLVTRR